MKSKFRKVLAEKCKDMGLTDKAIERLAELGAEGIDAAATDEEITAAVDSVVPYAAAMQAEITRKTRPAKPQPKPQPSPAEGATDTAPATTEQLPAWAQTMQEQLAALTKENADLKVERSRAAHARKVEAKAAALGIPAYLAKRLAIAEDADIEKELTALKQDMVTGNLMPKGAGGEPGSTVESMKADAKAWAAGLPNN